jgi:hypothetical protein
VTAPGLDGVGRVEEAVQAGVAAGERVITNVQKTLA